MNLLILGPQGSGKGTQAKILADKLGLFYLSSGDMLREIATTDPTVNERINIKGEMMPDDETLGYIKSYLIKKNVDLNNVIFDGYPRSLSQYESLKNWFKEENLKVDYAIHLEISDKEAIRRLSARRNCPKCGKIYNLVTSPVPKDPEKCDICNVELLLREDDKPEAIAKRLSIYKSTTQPLVDKLQEEGLLIKVDGERTISEISDELLLKLQK